MRFRVVIAATVWAISAAVLAVFLVRQASDPDGQYGFDFTVYYQAASDLAAGNSPYAAEMFLGPVAAQGALLYKYPPIFAQLLSPLTSASFSVATAIWLAIQGAAVFAGTWLAARLGGVPRSLEAFCWCGAATTLFLPNFDTLWKGNVSGILAFLTAVTLIGGVSGGLGVVSSVLVKTTPVVMLPAALAAGGRVYAGLVAGTIAAVVSFVLAPGAWIDFARVIPNLVSGDALFSTNLAPDIQVQLAIPSMPVLATLVRFVAVGVAAGAIVLSVAVARRPGGWPAAVALGVAATLLLPSATWYHYLAPLLPLAVFAWPRARRGARVLMLGGATAVTSGLLFLPLAIFGGAAMVVGILLAIWPRRAEAAA